MHCQHVQYKEHPPLGAASSRALSPEDEVTSADVQVVLDEYVAARESVIERHARHLLAVGPVGFGARHRGRMVQHLGNEEATERLAEGGLNPRAPRAAKVDRHGGIRGQIDTVAIDRLFAAREGGGETVADDRVPVVQRRAVEGQCAAVLALQLLKLRAVGRGRVCDFVDKVWLLSSERIEQRKLQGRRSIRNHNAAAGVVYLCHGNGSQLDLLHFLQPRNETQRQRRDGSGLL